MRTEVKKLEGNLVELTVEVDSGEVAKAIKKAYRKVASEVTIPGFRKGRVPPEIIDVKVGKEVVLKEALDDLLSSTYTAAVRENRVKPIDDPEIEIVQFEEEKPMIYRAKIEVKPEFSLPPLDVIKAERKTVEVTEEEVNEQLEKLRERFARLETKRLGEAKEGDYAVISFEGYVNGKREEKASMQDFLVELGSKTLMPEFESQLFGTRAGDIKKFSIKFPEDHHEPSIAGKDVEFSVIVKEIKQKVVPELNDEFAREVGGFESLENLRSVLGERIREMKEKQAEVEFENEILKSYVENTEVEIPEKLVEREIDRMIVDLTYNLAQQGLRLDDYLNYVQLTKEKLRESMKEEAKERVKTRLVLEKIVEEEDISVTEEEFEQEVRHLALRWGVKPEEVRKYLEEKGETDLLIYDIALSKAFKNLVEKYKNLGKEESEKAEESAREEVKPEEE